MCAAPSQHDTTHLTPCPQSVLLRAVHHRWGNNAGKKWRGNRNPTASINFVCAHDGFTLSDLVAYNDKHNEANGENNKDGESHNLSWNCGAEGNTERVDVNRCVRVFGSSFSQWCAGAGRSLCVAFGAHMRSRLCCQPICKHCPVADICHAV
jgi:hypothetical protein